MNTYTYFDHKKEQLLLQVEAENILEADKVFKEKTGIDAVKAPYIGCSIKFPAKRINFVKRFWHSEASARAPWILITLFLMPFVIICLWIKSFFWGKK